MATIKENSYSTTRTASKTKILVLFCVLFVILCGVAYACFFQFFNEKYFQQMIDNGITAKAEIFSCRQDNIRSPYACVYKYVDENGTEYIGGLKPIYKTKQEAETHIGETVEIYIDGKGKSIPVGIKTQVGYCLILVVISTLLVCADIVGIVIVSMKIHQNLKHSEIK